LFSQVTRYSPSDVVGIKVGDILLRVNDRDVREGTHKEVVDLIKRSPQPLKLTVYRPYKTFDGLPILCIGSRPLPCCLVHALDVDDDDNFEASGDTVQFSGFFVSY
jgi:hypothetical protein